MAVLGDVVAVEADERVYRVGDEAELDVELTVVELFGEGPGHVVIHKCHEIAVTVAYGGTEKLVRAHPATHIRTVRARAVKAFGIAHEDAADLALRLPGTTEDLSLAEPIGSIVPKGSCAVALDLVHAVRAQG
ncbi:MULTISPECIES: hypothetical protein [Streptomyces]|uniref:hypothetical protein n=1 Tax=Streptomyces TaxID=1883 RepID=UPI0004E6D3A2|nr:MULTISPECIES: hypothetical protein [Streptomyces]KFG05964.1 hypothetical protein IQ61_27400 [Streptomyces scabiei]MDX2837139.1 hypothetical protein [Streptomyces scabiei]MDX3681760.1 hypothetical protein [Streptomyces scabiei]